MVVTVRIQDGRERHGFVIRRDLRRRSDKYPTYNCTGDWGNLGENMDLLEMLFGLDLL